MTANRIKTIFRTVAKLIELSDLGVSSASTVKGQFIVAERQFSAGSDSADPYGELSSFLQPMLRSAQPVAQALDRVATIAKSAVDNYARAFAAELAQPPSATPSAIVAALAAEMTARAQTVQPSGRIFRYFRDGYAVELPQQSSPTISDSWVSTSVYYPGTFENPA